MDVVLKTNDPERYLALMQISRFADNSGFCCELVVRSHGFAVSMQLCFEPAALVAFHSELERMDSSLMGSATLKPQYEDPYIRLELSHTGAVTVSGELSRFDEEATHRLAFGFRTDQTCLGPFVRELGACFQLTAV